MRPNHESGLRQAPRERRATRTCPVHLGLPGSGCEGSGETPSTKPEQPCCLRVMAVPVAVLGQEDRQQGGAGEVQIKDGVWLRQRWCWLLRHDKHARETGGDNQELIAVLCKFCKLNVVLQ